MVGIDRDIFDMTNNSEIVDAFFFFFLVFASRLSEHTLYSSQGQVIITIGNGKKKEGTLQFPFHNHRPRADNAVVVLLIDDHDAIVPSLAMVLVPVESLVELRPGDGPRGGQCLQTLEEATVVVVPRQRSNRVPFRVLG